MLTFLCFDFIGSRLHLSQCWQFILPKTLVRSSRGLWSDGSGLYLWNPVLPAPCLHHHEDHDVSRSVHPLNADP